MGLAWRLQRGRVVLMLELLRDVDFNLTRVQQNVAKEFARVEGLIPSSSTTKPSYVSADYTVKLTDSVILASPVATLNVTLPDASVCSGQRFTVKNKGATPQTVNVRGATVAGTAQTIDGGATYGLAQGARVTLLSIGTGWESI